MASTKVKKPPPDDAAKAKLAIDAEQPNKDLVADVDDQMALVKANAAFDTTPSVQTAYNTLKVSRDALSDTLDSEDTKRSEMITLGQQAATERLQMLRDQKGLEAAINSASGGKAAAILKWGASVVGKTSLPPTTDAPVNLRATSADSSVTMRCGQDPQAKGFWFQWGTTDPAHPENWPAAVFANGVKHTVPNLTPGTKLYYRAAVQRRKTGQGQWSEIASITVK